MMAGMFESGRGLIVARVQEARSDSEIRGDTAILHADCGFA
jgi:hypothetical protein